ncbi:N-acetyltransferase [Candidatus Woesearchaeota archaeon]|nr:N-acetyltransferase [Candidatus Woesearchaeota archaeon]
MAEQKVQQKSEQQYQPNQHQLINNCFIGRNTKIWNFVNIYDCTIGDNCMVGTFVEIQKDVAIGNNCRIQSHSFICSLVTIEDNVFVGHGVMFINDLLPPSGDPKNWKRTIIKKGASIGSNATILPVTIGENSIIGAGAVVTKDVPADSVVVGNPAKVLRQLNQKEKEMINKK